MSVFYCVSKRDSHISAFKNEWNVRYGHIRPRVHQVHTMNEMLRRFNGKVEVPDQRCDNWSIEFFEFETEEDLVMFKLVYN
jgi:hypothetical protein